MGLLERREPRVLFYDIECSPLLAASWGPRWKANLVDVVVDWKLLCFAYRWADTSITRCVSQDDQAGWDATRRPWAHEDDRDVTVALWELLDAADVVVAHNGDGFDNKKANAKFLEWGLPPPSSYRSVDTLKVARKRFKLTDNRLDGIAALLDLDGKHSTDYDLWKGCMAGEASAWTKMKRYAKQDVDVLIAVYLSLLPWIDTHPHLGLMSGQPDNCRNCGQEALVPDGGFTYTATRVRVAVRCSECAAPQHTTQSLAKVAATYS